MARGTVNLIVDTISFVNLLGLAVTGLIMKYILPPGSGGGPGMGFRGGRSTEAAKELWSLSRHEWGTVHFYLAVLFVALMAIHIVLHWDWVKCQIKRTTARIS